MRRKVAAIVGAYGGMGTEISHRLYQDGYDLALMGRNLQKLEKLATALAPREDRQISTYAIDLSQISLVTDAVSELFDSYTKIDTLVYAAGVVIPGSLVHLDINDWKIAAHTNLIGMVHTVSLFWKTDGEPKGRQHHLNQWSSLFATRSKYADQ